MDNCFRFASFSFLPIIVQAVVYEEVLYQQLFANYRKSIRPATTTEATALNIIFHYFILLSMDQQQESITFSADFEIQWVDVNLQWTPSAENGFLAQLIIHETDVWVPDVALVDGIAQDDVIDRSNRLATVKSNGLVAISNPSVKTTKCQLNVDDFPFDDQLCEVALGSWAYNQEELTISTETTEIELPSDEYRGNTEWEVKKITAQEYIDDDNSENETYQELHYFIEMKRKPTYYVYVLILPTFIVTTLCICGLFSPFNNEGGRNEKVTLGLTTLLSLAVMLDIIGNDMPKVSKLPRLVLTTVAIQLAHHRANTRWLLPTPGINRTILEKFTYKKVPSENIKEFAVSERYAHTANTTIVREFKCCRRTGEDVCCWIDRAKEREDLRVYWIKFFDKIDLFLFIFFQLANIILTLCIILV